MPRFLGFSINKTLGAAPEGPADAILTVSANTTTIANNFNGLVTTFAAGDYIASNIVYASDPQLTASEQALINLVPGIQIPPDPNPNTSIVSYSEQYGSVSRNTTVAYAANGLITSINTVEVS